ncbi:MAG TPA: hypothetical protein DCX06_02670 [Opitutae bacterium]|nr:hypothetical protein [Opitutae bacterium]
MEKLIQVGVDLIPANGGIHKSTLQFSEAFGESPVISFTQRKEIPADATRHKPIQHFPLSQNKLLEWYGYANSKARIEAEKVASEADILCCNIMLRHHACWLRKFARRNERPYWFVTHGQLDPYVYTTRAIIKKLWLKVFGRKILKDAACVIFATERERQKAAWFYKGENTRVIHWPVELIDVSKKQTAREHIRSKLGLNPEDRLLIYLGRLHSMKNPRKTIEALAAGDAPNVHLAMVGPDHDESAESCRELARKLGVEDRVHVTGPVYGDDKDAYLLAADAFISLSQRENFGHTGAEALSASTPVILSPGNDLAQDLIPSACGFFLEDDHMKTAVRAIEAFASTSFDELGAMGERARKFSEEELSVAKFKERLQALADETLQKR